MSPIRQSGAFWAVAPGNPPGQSTGPHLSPWIVVAGIVVLLAIMTLIALMVRSRK